MRRLYQTIGWAIVLLGTLHMLAATQMFDQLDLRALWFVSAGVAIVLTGALNLLTAAYGAIAPGLRRVCFAANVFMTAFALIAGIVSKANLPQLIVVIGLHVLATVFSIRPSHPPVGSGG